MEGHGVAQGIAGIGQEGIPGYPGELGGSSRRQPLPGLLLDKVTPAGSHSLCWSPLLSGSRRKDLTGQAGIWLVPAGQTQRGIQLPRAVPELLLQEGE